MRKRPKLADGFYDRLAYSIHRARLSLMRRRQERVDAVRQYVGNHWSEEGTPEKVVLNMLSLYVSVVGRNLIAKNPRYLLSTFNQRIKPAVSAMQSWSNKEVERIRLHNTLKRVAVDALFSIGITKVALADPALAAVKAWNLAAGQAFADRIDLDDFAYDVHCRDFEEAAWMGHRYRVPLEVVRDSKLYSKERKNLTPSTDKLYNEQGDERISVMGRGTFTGNDEEMEDMVDLWEVYIPRHRLVVTLPDDYITGVTVGGEPLREQSWIGPDTGPYHLLGLGVVPGNAWPKAPIQDLMDLHLNCNEAMRKVLRMVARVKENTIVSGGALEDAKRLQEASDGDIVPVARPELIKTMVQSGGAIQLVYGIAQTLKELFDFMGGNIALMGGLSPQSKTATQDKMLNENSNRTVADMQDTFITYASEVGQSLLWFWWKDPFNVQRSQYQLPGMAEMQLERHLYPGSHPDQGQLRRMGDLPDIQVDPYSMQHSTPQSCLAALDEMMKGILIPMMPQLAQQGIVADFNAYLQKRASYTNQPDLQEIVTIQAPPSPDQGMGGPSDGVATKPGETTRNYVRESMPGRTPKGDSMNLTNTLLGVNPGGNPNTQEAPP